MKFYNKTLILAFFAVALLFYGCKKGEIDNRRFQDDNITTFLNTKTKIVNWIDLHKSFSKLESRSLNLLKQSLIFENSTIEKRKNGEDVIIIPLKDEVRENLKLNLNYSLKLITVKNNDGNDRLFSRR